MVSAIFSNFWTLFKTTASHSVFPLIVQFEFSSNLTDSVLLQPRKKTNFQHFIYALIWLPLVPLQLDIHFAKAHRHIFSVVHSVSSLNSLSAPVLRSFGGCQIVKCVSFVLFRFLLESGVRCSLQLISFHFLLQSNSIVSGCKLLQIYASGSFSVRSIRISILRDCGIGSFWMS